ncbi:MAG: MBL fold metallo-hydrolase [Candidatus Cloacimonetes bacterium]|nr:MBL fold metallo-hydrolase [Candidatus Cloacimonadota bacterium]
MLVKNIGHACLYINTQGLNIYTDFWIEHNMMGVCRRFPDFGEIEFNLPHPDYILLSHHHWDHIVIESLARLKKETKFIIPHSPQVYQILTKMGFSDITQIHPWEEYIIGEVKIIGTPSHVPFGELGYYIEDSQDAFLTLVDSVFHQEDILKINEISNGKLRFCFAPYQAYNEMDVILRKDFTPDRRTLKKNAFILKDLQVDLLIAYADGLYYPQSEYMNKKSFAYTPFEFIDEVLDLNPKQKCSICNPFDEFLANGGELKIQRYSNISIPDLISLYEDFRSFDKAYTPEWPMTYKGRKIAKAEKKKIKSYFEDKYLQSFDQTQRVHFVNLEMVFGLDILGLDFIVMMDFVKNICSIKKRAYLKDCNSVLHIRADNLIDLMCSRELLTRLMQSDEIALSGDTYPRAYKALDALKYGGFEDQFHLDKYIETASAKSYAQTIIE